MKHKFLARQRAATLFGGLFFAAIGVFPMQAELITDPAGDFLPSYTGPHNGDLDVLSAQVFLNGSDFQFTSTLNGSIGTTTGASYVWGIDRGAGKAGFPTIAPGVLFDAVFVINPAGGSAVHDLVDGASTTISDITISGATITGEVPLSALSSQGFAPADYLVNLWPVAGKGLSGISDFAPDNSDARVTATATPEPGTISLLGLAGLGAGLAVLRRRRTRLYAARSLEVPLG